VLLVEPSRDAERVLAADGDERVELRTPEVLQDFPDPALELERIRPGRPDDRPAAGQQSRDLPRPERLEQPLDEPVPALADTDHLAAAGHHPPAGRPNDGI